MRMDLQKYYNSFIFIYDFLGEIVDSQLKAFHIAWF